METFKDMHIHSTYSDGSNTVSDLIKELEEKQIGTFSITDHDSIESIVELKQLRTSLEWYSGVEVSTSYQGHKVHLLGYGFEEESSDIAGLLNWIKNQRRLRFYDMLEKAQKEFQVKIPFSYFETLEENGTILGRPHLMRYLVTLGCGEASMIMDQIEANCNSKISYRADLNWAIKCLKKAKALLIIAHPKEIENESHILFETMIENFIKLGIDGVEVYHSIHTEEDIKRYHELVLKYHLLESGGSDYHGIDRKGRVLGNVTRNGFKMKEMSLVEELRRRR